MPGRSNQCTVQYAFRATQPGIHMAELLLHIPVSNTVKTVLLQIQVTGNPVNVPPVPGGPGEITPPTLIAPRAPSPAPTGSSSH